MKEQITYRLLTKNDEPQIRAVFNIVKDGMPRKEFFRSNVDKLLARVNSPYIGAFDNDKLIGFASLVRDPERIKELVTQLEINSDGVCEFGAYMLLPEYRGRGIMQALQSELLELAKHSDIRLIIGVAHPENLASINILTRIMQPVGKTMTTSDGFLKQMFIKELK
jgi:RimJ/RimL family protein N-acetyltransferase